MNETLLTIPSCFENIANSYPDRIAIKIKKEDKWQALTFKDVHERALGIACFLSQQGFKKEGRVVIILENRPEWAFIYLGIMYANLTAVPLDPQLNPNSLMDLIKDSNAKILFCSAEIFLNKLKQNLPDNLSFSVVVDMENPETRNNQVVPFPQLIKDPDLKLNLPDVQTQDTASLIYTSGTTEKPKGVLLTHKNICSNFNSIKKSKIASSADNFLSLLPLHHTYPFMVTLILPLLLGAKITYSPRGFRPEDLARIIKEGGVTILQGVPQLFALIHSNISQKLKKIPSFLRLSFMPIVRYNIRKQFGKNLRILVSGGARLDANIGRELTQFGLKFTEGYGLTETSPVVTLNPLSKVKFGSVGKALPDIKIKIDNADKDGIGEILIQGPNVMAGYFRQPELTASVIKDNWFYSGDLGYIDEDGYLFVTGRKKDVLVLSSGKNIYPEELEEFYLKSPYIKEICVFEKQDVRFGKKSESLQAVIVPDLKQHQLTQEGNIRAKIKWELETIARDIPAYEHIMGFILTKEELPKTALRKLKRYEIRDKYIDHIKEAQQKVISDEDLKGLDADIAKKVIQYLAKELKMSVSLDDHLEIDLGIDSLSRVEMAVGLEKLFKLSLSDEALLTTSTVKELITKITDIHYAAKSENFNDTDTDKNTWQYILKRPPDEEILQKIEIKVTLLHRLSSFILKFLFLFIFRIFWLLRIKRHSFLPQKGPYIICANHASYFDGFFIFCSLPLNEAFKTYFFGYRGILEHWSIKWSLKLTRLVAIDASSRLTKAMRAAAYLLSNEKIICLFPEAERSINSEIKEFREGVGILVKELDVPVVPVYIKGSHQSWPRGNRFPSLYPVKLIFGKPLSRDELLKEKPADMSDYKAIAARLREEVLKLA